MTSRDFCFWLQGVFEVGKPETLDAGQTKLVRRHLALVFKHEIDPSMGPPEHQQELDAVHDGKQPGPEPPSIDTKDRPPWMRPQYPGGVIMRC